MDKNSIQKILEQEEKVSYVSEFKYQEKKYIKTIKILKAGINYIYYEISDDTIKKVENEKILADFKELYEGTEDNIIY